MSLEGISCRLSINRGEANSQCKFSDELVAEMRTLYAEGYGAGHIRSIMRRRGINIERGYVARICKGRARK